jgi:hypothetical protein
MGLTVLRWIKKALAMVPKLPPFIVLIVKNCAVFSYASSKNESSFMKFINNGMYALMISKGEAVIGDGGGSENDNEILGTTSVDGMRCNN